jgi:hypothetical protein
MPLLARGAQIAIIAVYAAVVLGANVHALCVQMWFFLHECELACIRVFVIFYVS